jgi:hypothetical protein
MKFKEFLRLPGGIKILFNKRNWVLEVGGESNRSYFACLDDLFDDLLDTRLSLEANKAKKLKNDIRQVLKMIRDSREIVRQDLRLLKAKKEAKAGRRKAF